MSKIISKNFFAKTNTLSPESRLLYLYLCITADEKNIAKNNAKVLEAEVFPYQEVNIPQLLEELEKAGLIAIEGNIIRLFSGKRNVLPKKIDQKIANDIDQMMVYDPQKGLKIYNFPPSNISSSETLKEKEEREKPEKTEKEKESNKEKEKEKKEQKEKEERENIMVFKDLSLNTNAKLTISEELPVSENLSRNSTSKWKVFKKGETACDERASPTRFLLSEYRRLYEAKYGKKPVQNWGKDGTIAKRIMSQPAVTVENITQFLERFFQEEDDFIKKVGHTLGVFEKRLPGYLERRVWVNNKKFPETVSVGEAAKECLKL